MSIAQLTMHIPSPGPWFPIIGRPTFQLRPRRAEKYLIIPRLTDANTWESWKQMSCSVWKQMLAEWPNYRL